MAKDEIIIKAELQVAQARTNIKKLNKEIQGLDMRLTESKLKVKQLANEELKLAKGKQLLTQRNKELTLSQNKLSNSTGAATSAALELGRVFSDAPYGIRGVANNVSQLASQFSFMANEVDKTTGKVVGFQGALKNFGRALKANAVLLAIQAIIAALEYFSSRSQQAKKSADGLTESLERQITPLEKLINLYKSLSGVLFTSKDNEAINAFNNNFLSLDETVKVLTRNFSQFKNAYDKLSEDDKKNKESVKALVRGYEELLSLRKLEEEQIKKMQSLRDDIAKKGETQIRNGVTVTRQEAKDLKSLEIQYVKTQKRLVQLEDFFRKDSGGDDNDKLDRVSGLLGLDMIDPEKEAKKAQKILNTVIKSISSDLFEDGVFTDFSDNPKTVLDLLPTPTDEQVEQLKISLQQYVDIYKEIMGSVSSFLQGESDRQIAIEANKTNAMNAELNNRLLNENLSKGERERIQNEIAQNDEELRKKQNAIKKRAFNTQKAFNISMATIDTYAGAAKALATLPPPASFAVAGATIASGLLQVATIARQKFQPDAASTPIRTSGSGGAGGVGNRTFDFNLIGNNQNNQLADAIGSTFDKPVKAYVVSKDITNQQQLDANTKSAARFGD